MSESGGDISAQSLSIEMQIQDAQGAGGLEYMAKFGKLSEQTFADVGAAVSKAFDPGEVNDWYQTQVHVLQTYRDELKELTTFIKFNKHMGEDYSKHLKQVEDISDKIMEMRSNQEEYNRILPGGHKYLVEAVESINRIYDGIGRAESQTNKLNRALSEIGLGNIGKFIAGLESGTAVIGMMTHLTMSYLEQQSKWTRQNYALYGSIRDVNQQVIAASRNGTLLMEEAAVAAKSLMEVSVAHDSLVELTATLGDVTRETGLASDVGARYAKQMQLMGYQTKIISGQFRFLKMAAASWGITGSEADKIFGKISQSAFTMHQRLGDAGFNEYQRNLLRIGGAAKVAGADLNTMLDVMSDLEKDRTKFVLLMSGTDWLNEKDTTKLMQAMIGNAHDALSYVGTFPAAIQEEVAQSMYGVSLETLNQMEKMAKAGGAHLGGLIPKGFADEWRRLTDPMYGFQLAIKDIGQVIQFILTPIILLVNLLGVAAGWFTKLPEPIKYVVGSLIFFGLVMAGLSGGLATFTGWVVTAIGSLFSFGGATAAVAAETAATTTTLASSLSAFGAAMTPVIAPILAIAGAFLMLGAGVWLLANSVTSVDKFIGALAGLGIGLLGFASIALISSYLLGAAAVPMLAAGAAFLLIAASVWVLSEAFGAFAQSLKVLSSVNLIKLGLEMVLGGSMILLGMGTLLAAAVLGAVMAPFALLAGIGLIAMITPLYLLDNVIKGGSIERLPKFGAMLTIGMAAMAGGLALAAVLSPLALLAGVTFLAIGISLGIFTDAISKDISGAVKFSALLTLSLYALSPALALAGIMSPLAILAGVTFAVLGLSLAIFASVLKSDIGGAAGFATRLTIALGILAPALALAAVMSPLAILAGVTFTVLGLSLMVFGKALQFKIDDALGFAIRLTGALYVLAPALALAAALSPLAILAGITFTVFGLSLMVFSKALQFKIDDALGFAVRLTGALGILAPALALAAMMSPLAILAGITFTVFGLSLMVFGKALQFKIDDALGFAMRLTGALYVLAPALALAAMMSPLAILAGITFTVLGLSLMVFGKALQFKIDDALGFAIRLTGALYVLASALTLAAFMLPLALLAGVTFAVLSLSLTMFAKALQFKIDDALGFAMRLTGALYVLSPALALAAIMLPLAVAAGLTFAILGLSLMVFAKALELDVLNAIGFSVRLTVALLTLAPALVLAAALSPLALAAGLTFTILGLSLMVFSKALTAPIGDALAFGLELTGAMLAMVPALLTAALMSPLALAAGFTFTILGLSLRLLTGVLQTPIDKAIEFGLTLSSAMFELRIGLMVAAGLLPFAIIAAASFVITAAALFLIVKTMSALAPSIEELPATARALNIGLISIAGAMASISGLGADAFIGAAMLAGAGVLLAIGFTSITAAFLIAISIMPLAALAIVAFGITKIALNTLLGALRNNAGGIATLPNIAAYFARGMEGLAVGMDALASSRYIMFVVAAEFVANGLNKILNILTNNASGVAGLSNVAGHIQGALSEIRYGIDWMVGSNYRKFPEAAAAAGQGLSSILGVFSQNTAGIAALPGFVQSFGGMLGSIREAIVLATSGSMGGLKLFATQLLDGLSVLFLGISKNQDVIDRLPVMVGAIQDLATLSDSITGGQGMIDMATSVDTALATMGDGLADYATYVEASTARISAALDLVHSKAADFANGSINQVVKNDQIITIHPNLDNSDAVGRHEESMDKLDKLTTMIGSLVDAIKDKDDDEGSSNILQVLNEYLPAIAEANSSGLGARSNGWVSNG